MNVINEEITGNDNTYQLKFKKNSNNVEDIYNHNQNIYSNDICNY